MIKLGIKIAKNTEKGNDFCIFHLGEMFVILLVNNILYIIYLFNKKFDF